MKKQNTWFTLIEVIVSVAIFSIVMVSIISLYILSTNTSLKSDINRIMHENIKSAITEISEDIIKNWISWVSSSILSSCDFPLSWEYWNWTKLCTWFWDSRNKYFLAKKDITWIYTRTANSDCENFIEQCYLMKNDTPLTNSLVSIKKLNFYISNEEINKVTIAIELQPSVKAWVKPSLIKNNKLVFQTTISERLLNLKK